METGTPGWTLGSLAELLGGVAASHPHYRVLRPVPADSDDPEGIAFCESEVYLERAHQHGVGALILPYNLHSSSKPVIHVESPRLAFGMLLAMTARPLPLNAGIHPTAIVSEEASIDESASVGAYCVVERGAKLGAGVKVYPHCYVGENCHLGAGSVLFPRVTLYQDVTLGERCVIHGGAVLGADGFGFMWDGAKQRKVPQVGRVVLGDEVEVGANTTIDRATAGATTIGSGTKLDNHCQIAHNVSIGVNGVIAAQAGISGSAKIGDRVMMGGQCGVADHVTIPDDVIFGGRTGAPTDIPQKGAYFGMPAIPAADGLRSYLLIGKLPDIYSRLKAMERKLKELEGPSE